MNLNRNFYKYFRTYAIPAFFLIAGIIVTIIGGIIYNAKGDTSNYVDGTATIVEFVPNGTDEDGQTQYITMVEYEVDGVKYGPTQLDSWSSDMKVGDTVDIKYNPDDPNELISSLFIYYIPLGVGILLLVIGVIILIRNVRKTKEYYAQEEQYAQNNPDFAQRASVSNPLQVNENAQPIADWNQPNVKRYYFSFDKHLKQGYYMEDQNRTMVYEAKMSKLTFFSAFEFEFINKELYSSVKHKVGHTVTHYVNDFVANSNVSFDGRDIWDILHEKGIRIESNMTSLTSFDYEVSLAGAPFASIHTTGSSLHEDEPKNPFSDVAVNGRFRIRTYSDDTDLVFLVCFAMARCHNQMVFD